MPADAPARIGMIAGGGAVPAEIAQAIIDSGADLYVIAIDGEADAAILEFRHKSFGWFGVGRAVKELRDAGVSDVVLVGTMSRPKLSSARIDLSFVKALPAILKILRQGGDDALLRVVIDFFERRGLRVVGVRDVAPGMLLPEGRLGLRAPLPADDADIALGFRLIAALGRFDIGQAAIVGGGRVIAIEGAEGTDAMLRRAAGLRGEEALASEGRSGVLVKRPKPAQDLRIDLPAIGPGTAIAAGAAGLAGVAAEAGYVITANRGEMIAAADEIGIFVLGVAGGREAAQDPEVTTLAPKAPVTFKHIGAVSIQHSARDDAELGLGVLSVLRDFATGSALVVRRGRVMAIGASEPALDVLVRDASYNSKPNRRRGAAVIAASELVDGALIEAAAEAGVAAVVLQPEHLAAARNISALAATANSLRIALVAVQPLAPETAR